MRARLAVLVPATMFWLAPALVFAEDEDRDPYARRGIYMSGGAVAAFHLFEDEIEKNIGARTDIKPAVGANGRLGYRITDWLAAEGEFEWVSGFKIETLGSKVADLEALSFTVNAKFIAPLGRWQPYAKFGLGPGHYKVNEAGGDSAIGRALENSSTGLIIRPAIGLDVYMTPNWVGYVELAGNLFFNNIALEKKSLSELYYLSTQLGLQYRF